MAEFTVELKPGETLMKAVYKPTEGEPRELLLHPNHLEARLLNSQVGNAGRKRFRADLIAQGWATIQLSNVHHIMAVRVLAR